MTVRVVSGPAPIAIPSDVMGSHAPTDAKITALIAAVQAGIDGPTGWLNRALGEQTLELTRADFRRSIRLPYQPVMSAVSVKYLDPQGVERTVDPDNYRTNVDTLLFRPAFTLPAVECAEDAVRIQYKAGYEAGQVPPSAKQAVIIGVMHLKTISDQSLFLRSEEVEGIGTTTYTVGEGATETIKAATESLIKWLKVYPL